MYYIEITHTNGERYGVLAMEIDLDNGTLGYTADISLLDANGEPTKTIVDGNNAADEDVYDNPRECLLRAVGEVI